MDIYNYIEPVKSTWISYPGISNEESLGGQIAWFDGTAEWFRDEDYDIAILGVPEVRNSQRAVSGNAPDLIRKWLYGMRSVSSREKIADLGNVKGNSLDDRYYAVNETVTYLEQKGVVVLLLGGSQDLTVPVCGFFHKKEKGLNLAVVDAFIDVHPRNEDFSGNAFLNKLVADFGPKNIEDLNVLGCQTYYCSEEQERFLEKNHFRLIRLKDLRDEKISSVEVFLRQTEVLSFDFSAIKGQPVLPDENSMPNGFSEQEACRIFWYAGASDGLKVAGIFNFPLPLKDGSNQGPVAAQMCWHFLEGRGARSGDYPVRPYQDYELKVVYIDEFDATLNFYHNPENNRWWIMVPSGDGERLVSCEETDYQTAMDKELPALWWHFFIKYRENGKN